MSDNAPVQPPYPQGTLMVKDPDNPGLFVRDPNHQAEARRYDEWVWNVKARQELRDLNERIEQFLASCNTPTNRQPK